MSKFRVGLGPCVFPAAANVCHSSSPGDEGRPAARCEVPGQVPRAVCPGHCRQGVHQRCLSRKTSSRERYGASMKADMRAVVAHRADSQDLNPREEDPRPIPPGRRQHCDAPDQRWRLPSRVSTFFTFARGRHAPAGFHPGACWIRFASRVSPLGQQEPRRRARASLPPGHLYWCSSNRQRGRIECSKSYPHIFGRAPSPACRCESHHLEPAAATRIWSSSAQDGAHAGLQGAVADSRGPPASARRRTYPVCGSAVPTQLPSRVFPVLISLPRNVPCGFSRALWGTATAPIAGRRRLAEDYKMLSRRWP